MVRHPEVDPKDCPDIWHTEDHHFAPECSTCGEESDVEYPQSLATFRRYAFAKRSVQGEQQVMHISFGKGEGELKPLNIAIPLGDAASLRDALIRQIGSR